MPRLFAYLTITLALSFAGAAHAQQTYETTVSRSTPTAVNWHFNVRPNCSFVLPEIRLVRAPSGVRIWTETRDYRVAREDIVFGDAVCIGRLIQAVYVIAEVDQDVAGPEIQIVYDRILGGASTRWTVTVEVKN